MVDFARLDLLFQYAMAAASQADDPRDRELGPIHLLKYAYLGDLAYAETHDGEPFTGVEWRFHHFGPWAVSAWQRIPAAMSAVAAQERRFASQYRDDNVRWRLSGAGDPDSIAPGVPVEAALAIRRAVRAIGNDTVTLLHHVYRTPPMLRSAPGDVLDFRRTPSSDEDLPNDPDVPDELAARAALPKLSKTRLKKLRERVRANLASRPAVQRTVPSPPPRFDDLYARGADWLDGLAGEPLEPQEGVLELSPEVWRSRGRGESELP